MRYIFSPSQIHLGARQPWSPIMQSRVGLCLDYRYHVTLKTAFQKSSPIVLDDDINNLRYPTPLFHLRWSVLRVYDRIPSKTDPQVRMESFHICPLRLVLVERYSLG